MYVMDFLHKFVPAKMMFFRHLNLSMIFFIVSYRSKKLLWLLFPTMDKLSDVSRCPHGNIVEIVLSSVSFEAIKSNVLRLVDLATRIAIILLSPRILR